MTDDKDLRKEDLNAQEKKAREKKIREMTERACDKNEDALTRLSKS